MSVKQHEAFSFDSFQDMLLFFDDFHGDQMQDEWRAAGAATGSAVVVDQQTGGIVRITSGNVITNNYRIDWGDIRSLHVDQRVSMEARVKLSLATLCIYQLALRFDVNNRIYFIYDSTLGANWRIRCRNVAETSQDSGVAADTSYHIFRIECFPTGEVHFFIDGTECTNSPITTNIPDDAGDYLQPYFLVQTRTNADRSMDVDYCYLREER